MDNLEKYFIENREKFDDAEPLTGHFSRFEEKYDERFNRPSLMQNRSILLKIAAGILVLLTVSVFIFDFAADRFNKTMIGENAGTGLPSEIRDVVRYYDDASANRLGEIHKLACCGQNTENIYSDASVELKNLDMNTDELTKSLKENPNDERIQAALIQNQQMKEKLVETVITQMNKVNSQKK